MKLNDLGFELVKKQKEILGVKINYTKLVEYYCNARQKSQEKIMYIWQHPDQYEAPVEKNCKAELFYVYSGKAEIIVHKKKVVLSAGNFLYLTTDVAYQVLKTAPGDILIRLSPPSNEYIVTLQEKIMQSTVNNQNVLQAKDQLLEVGVLIFNSEKLDDPAYIMERILCDYYTPDEYSIIAIEAKLSLLLIELFRGDYICFDQVLVKHKDLQISDIYKYIDTHFQTIDLKEMAYFFNYHPHYLSNMIKEKTGRSFMELVHIKRMATAAILLTNPQLSTSEISEYIGYCSQSFFYKKFKAFFAMTPLEMRKNLLKEE